MKKGEGISHPHKRPPTYRKPEKVQKLRLPWFIVTGDFGWIARSEGPRSLGYGYKKRKPCF